MNHGTFGKAAKLQIASLALCAALLSAAGAQAAPAAGETRYLVFQVWPAQPGYPGIPPLPGRLSLTQEQMKSFVAEVSRAIGSKGNRFHKLGFSLGPFTFDIPDEETRQWIHDAFAVAKETDTALALHIDDSMAWSKRKDLLENPDNIEAADWSLHPSSARRLDWGPEPTRFPPQMCYNAPAIAAAARARATVIGGQVKRELEALRSAGKEYLFAGVIAGWETQIGREFGTNRPLGFRALAHRGFSAAKPPGNGDAERVGVVKEWMELWAKALHAAGVPRDKIFCHIAFTSQGLAPRGKEEAPAQAVNFALPEVAFSTDYRPGFSTYPEGSAFQEIQGVLARHGHPPWISAEGTNVSPTGMPGEPSMESYLGRVFNHGGVLANIFSWGIGGEAQRRVNFFRLATEGTEALRAYAKFLRGEKLEEAAAGFGESFAGKLRRIQAELPEWARRSGRQAQVMPKVKNLEAMIQKRSWHEASAQADELLKMIDGKSP